VKVTAKNPQTGLERSALTDSAGDFTIPGLPVAGKYSVTASKQGFADREITDLKLVSGATADLEIQLNLAAGVSEVTVTGVVGQVRTDAPQLGNRLDAAQIEETPILNRRVTYLPLLNAANRPAINQGDIFTNQFLITTNGSGRRQTTFVVDGGTANDSWGRQTVFTAPPMAAVGEMTVLTNAFSAEFGANTGALVKVVT
jgi:hypothetical protein